MSKPGAMIFLNDRRLLKKLMLLGVPTTDFGNKAICMTFSGQSHRGSDRDQIELNFVKFR